MPQKQPLKEGVSFPATIVFNTPDGIFGGYVTMKVVKGLGDNKFEITIPAFMAYDEGGNAVGMHAGVPSIQGVSEPEEAMENKQ